MNLKIKTHHDIVPSMDLKMICTQKNPPYDFCYNESYENYQKFLYLHFKYCGTPMCPTPHIDHVWHQHMLNPIIYHQDCMKWFGKILGHDAILGLTEDGKKLLKERTMFMSVIWKQEFDEEFGDKINNEDPDNKILNMSNPKKRTRTNDSSPDVAECWDGCG